MDIDGYIYIWTYNIYIHKWFKHVKYLLNCFSVNKCIDLTHNGIHTTRRWLVTYNVPFFPGVQIASETVFRPLNLSLMTPGNVLVLAVTWNFGCCVGNWLPAWMGWLRFFDWVTCILKRWVRVLGLIVGIEGCSCDLIIACWLFKTKV